MSVRSTGAAIAFALMPQPARSIAPVVIYAALAVAAALARKVASSNSTDGGLMATVQANHELLMEALGKLNFIQDTLIKVYELLANLPNEIDQILTRHETRELQVEVSSVIAGYQQLRNNKDKAQPLESWLKNASTQTRLQFLLSRLQQARQKLQVLDLCDPATALVIGPAGFVENGLLNLLHTPDPEIQNTLENEYITFLDRIMDSKHVGSAAHYMVTAAKRHNDYAATASSTPLGQRLGFPAGSVGRKFDTETRSTGLACVGFNDFTRGYEGGCPGGGDGPRDRPGHLLVVPITPEGKEVAEDKLTEILGTPRPDAQKLLSNPKLLGDNGIILACMPGKPDRVGPYDRLTSSVNLSQYELLDNDGTTTGVKLWKFERETKRFTAAAPHDPAGCGIVQEDSQDPGVRSNRMQTLPAWTDGNAAFAAFDKLIDDINLEGVRFAFGLEAVIAAQTARDGLRKIIRSYG